MEFWNQRTFCLITGASRGIGKSIAIEFSKNVGPGSVFVLIARSGQGLGETKAEIYSSGVNVLKIVVAPIDLGKAEKLDYFDIINDALLSTGTRPEDFQHAILVHNAVTAGDVTRHAIQMDNAAELRDYYDMNLISMILLTSQFFAIFSDEGKQRSVVHISSGSAKNPCKALSLLGSVKAAREIFMRSIAKEDPSISTINYVPGPVETDMYSYMQENIVDPDMSKFLEDMKSSGQLLTADQIVTKLVKVLGGKQYTNGEHVCYKDIVD